jgi:hypothetical protein
MHRRMVQVIVTVVFAWLVALAVCAFAYLRWLWGMAMRFE